MSAQWVDYKHLRETLDFAEVLRAYGVELKLRGEQHQGFCPLPSHAGTRRKSPSFSANLKRGIWQCFGCQAKGNVIEFAARMEGLDPDNKADFRKAALMLQERFLGDPESAPRASENDDDEKPASKEPAAPQDTRPRVVNQPLNFELKRLDTGHAYLKERGLSPETIQHFGLGYCGQGLMKGRIAIPLHDSEGHLIGYAGRLVDDDAVGENSPKYLLPGSREREGVLHEFSKSVFLFNGFRVPKPVHDLIVVEGFFDLFHLHQHGYRNVVALMGATCSADQARLIVALTADDGRVLMMPDGDPAGEKCAVSLFQGVAPSRLVRWVRLPQGKQPDSFDAPELSALLRSLS
jgi:DNA primase